MFLLMSIFSWRPVGGMDGWMIHQMVFHSYFLVPMGKMQLLWLRVMIPFIRKSLKAAHFVSQFFVAISFFKNFEIFHHNWGQNRSYITGSHIFFHYPQAIGFRLIMREIFRQCRLLFYCFFSSLPCRCYCSLYLIFNQDRKINQRQFPLSFWRGVREGAWWALVTMTTVG